MAEIILLPKGRIGIMVEAEVIRPDSFAERRKRRSRGCSSGRGRRASSKRVFRCGCERVASPEETTILIEGDVSRVKRIGQGMKAGRIEIFGSAGMHLGAEMAEAASSSRAMPAPGQAWR